MEVLKDNDLVLVKGGGTESTLINAFTNVFKILFEAGVGMGSSFRRYNLFTIGKYLGTNIRCFLN